MSITGYTTQQLMDAVRSDFLKLKKENEELKSTSQAQQEELDELWDKHNKRLKTNKSLNTYINNLEEQLLQMRLKNSFYESMFEEQVPKPLEQTSKPNLPSSIDRRIELFKEKEHIRNESKDATQEHPPLEQKMKKTKQPKVVNRSNFPSREPTYHMTEVARDWSS